MGIQFTVEQAISGVGGRRNVWWWWWKMNRWRRYEGRGWKTMEERKRMGCGLACTVEEAKECWCWWRILCGSGLKWMKWRLRDCKCVKSNNVCLQVDSELQVEDMRMKIL